MTRVLIHPLIGFVVTNFEGHWPVGTAAIAYGRDREEAKRVLRAKLREQGLGKDDPDQWTLEPITPAPAEATAYVVLNGDY
jgi:hypothetical protein